MVGSSCESVEEMVDISSVGVVVALSRDGEAPAVDDEWLELDCVEYLHLK